MPNRRIPPRPHAHHLPLQGRRPYPGVPQMTTDFTLFLGTSIGLAMVWRIRRGRSHYPLATEARSSDRGMRPSCDGWLTSRHQRHLGTRILGLLQKASTCQM